VVIDSNKPTMHNSMVQTFHNSECSKDNKPSPGQERPNGASD